MWTSSSSADRRRLGRILQRPDGSWKIDEETYKPLDRFSLGPAFVDPDGATWFAGEYLIRLSPRTAAAQTVPFATLVRQIHSGTKTVFGGSIVP
jgi:hypothetical protein